MANLDVMMSRISKLISTAEGEAELGNSETAATYRAKAEMLMREYRIEQQDLLAEDATAVEPVMVFMDLYEIPTKFRSAYYGMLNAIAHHTGIEFLLRNDREEGTGRYVRRASMVGYEGDLRYAEYLFQAARLVFTRRIDVQPDPLLSDEDNVYRLRSAGWNRYEIAQALWADTTAKFTMRATNLYRKACAARNEEPLVSGRSVSAKNFQQMYAEGFVMELYRVLREARDAADTAGGAVQLHGRSARVLEAFWNFFPHLRPTEVEPANDKPVKSRKRKTWTQADEARYQRRNKREVLLAQASGAAAAREVEVDRASRAQRVESHNGTASGAIEA